MTVTPNPELRQEVVEALKEALTFKWPDHESEPLWAVYKPGGMALHLADAVLALPGLQRALTITTALDAAVEESTPSGRAPVIDGHRAFYGDEALARLRAVGEVAAGKGFGREPISGDTIERPTP